MEPYTDRERRPSVWTWVCPTLCWPSHLTFEDSLPSCFNENDALFQLLNFYISIVLGVRPSNFCFYTVSQCDGIGYRATFESSWLLSHSQHLVLCFPDPYTYILVDFFGRGGLARCFFFFFSWLPEMILIC